MLAIDFVPMSSARIITVYVGYLFIAVLFILFGLKLNARGTGTVQKRYITKYFYYVAIGLFLNMLYAPFDVDFMQIYGSRAVILTTTLGVTNIMFFTLVVFKSTKEVSLALTRKIELAVFLAAAIGYFGLEGGVNEDYTPWWSVALAIYIMVVVIAVWSVAMVFGIKVLGSMQNNSLKGRFSAFLVGMVLTLVVALAAVTRNGGWLGANLATILTLMVVPAGLLIYYGVIKPFN
jgi:hypothetical protein